MATTYQIRYVCEMCGLIAVSDKPGWTEAQIAALGAGWMFLRLSSGWRHFCQDCTHEIQAFIGGARNASEQPVRPSVKPKFKNSGKAKKSANMAKQFAGMRVEQERLRQDFFDIINRDNT